MKSIRTKTLSRLAALGLVFGSGACNNTVGEVPAEEVSAARQAVWVNGGFEVGAGATVPTGWGASSNLNSNGVTFQTPQTYAGLGLQPGGAVAIEIVGGPNTPVESLSDLNAPAVKFPRYGSGAARINNSPSVLGNGQNSNTLTQTMVIGPGDIDPVDGKIHTRFTIAPILENPNHPAAQQPYYFVQMTNKSNGDAVLTQDFEVSNAPGVPWQNAGNSVLFTSWQLVDLDPGSTVALGDTVELKVIATGCQPSGHYGRVYVDAFGNRPPGTFVQGRVQKLANAGEDIAYDLTYENGANTPATSTVVTFATPNNTTFKSISGINGCTLPAVGAAGSIVCPIGTVAGNTSGTLKVVVTIDPATAVGTRINQGDYKIKSDGLTELLGPHLATDVTSGATYTDLRTTISSGLASIDWLAPISYQIVVKNAGPNAAPVVNVTDSFPAQLTGITWTCAGSGGGVCGAAAGIGNLATTANLPLNATVTYTVNASVVAGVGIGKLVNAATATPGGTVTESASFDNTASETIPIVTQRVLTITKNNLGTISSFPAAINCGANCTTANAKFADGSAVVLHADTPAGGQFIRWGGACSGALPDCTVTMGTAQTATAKFVGAPGTIAIVDGGTQSTKVTTAYAKALQVVVKDGQGNAVPNVWISYGVAPSGASASLSTYGTTTDSNGNASATAWANTVSGLHEVSATYPGALAPVKFALTNTPDAAAAIAIANASSNQATLVGTPFGLPLTVSVVDKFGNPVPSANVTFVRPAGEPNAKLSAPTATTDANGNATVTATATSVVGTYIVTAGLDANGPTVDFVLSNTGIAPLSLSIVSGTPANGTVKTAFAAPLKVLVTSNAVPVKGALVTFVAPARGASATLSAFTATTDALGQAQVTATANAKSGAYSVVASSNGASKAAAFALTNDAGAPARIVVSGLSSPQSALINSGFPLPLIATVVDADGNPVAGKTVTFAAPGSAPKAVLSAASAVTNANGQAQITAVAGSTVGTYSVTLSTPGVPNGAISLTNTGVAPNTLVITSGNPQSSTAGAPFAQKITVKVLDASGLPIAGSTVTFSAPSSGPSATLSSASAVTNALGIAEITATAGEQAGLYLVQAALPGTSGEVAFQLTNAPGAPFSVGVAASASPQSTIVTTAFALPLSLTVADKFGNPVAGVITTFALPAGEPTASLGKTTLATDRYGSVSTLALAGKQEGTYAVAASAAGVATPGTFALTNSKGAPATIGIKSGASQSTTVLTNFKDAIVATVADANGAPVAGAVIVVTAPTTGASGTSSPQTVVTDVVGSAALTVTANDKAGTFTLALSVGGASTPANANLTNVALPVPAPPPPPDTSTNAKPASILPTQTTLDVATEGSTTLFAATVRAAGGTPSGTVRFQVDGRDVGTAPLKGSTATLDLQGVAPGSHKATAFYDAQSTFEASNSGSKDFAIADAFVLQGGGIGCSSSRTTGGNWFAFLGIAGVALLLRRRQR